MTNKEIAFGNEFNAQNIFFFGLSELNDKRNHICTVANRYSLNFRGKHVLLDKNISQNLPDFCYLKINKALEKNRCFIVTNANQVLSQKATSQDLQGIDLVSRPYSATKNTVKYYNAKSKLGNIHSVVVTYELEGRKGIFFDNYLFHNGNFITVTYPCHHYEPQLNLFGIDYSEVLFKDFERIQ